jgi:hypothetical protein
MGFDIDVLVRLIWAGAGVETVRTRVVYPRRRVRTSARCATTCASPHPRASLLWPAQAPAGLARAAAPAPQSTQRHWSRLEERGSNLGLALHAATARLLGRQAACDRLLPAVAWFFVTGRQGDGALRDLSRAPRRAFDPPTIWNVWRHMLAFADASLDKIAAWRGEIEGAVDFHGVEEFERLRAKSAARCSSARTSATWR